MSFAGPRWGALWSVVLLCVVVSSCAPRVYRRPDLPDDYELFYGEATWTLFLPPTWTETTAQVDEKNGTGLWRMAPRVAGELAELPYAEVLVNRGFVFDAEQARGVYAKLAELHREQQGFLPAERERHPELLMARPIFAAMNDADPAFMRAVWRRWTDGRARVEWEANWFTPRGLLRLTLVMSPEQFQSEKDMWNKVVDGFRPAPEMLR